MLVAARVRTHLVVERSTELRRMGTWIYGNVHLRSAKNSLVVYTIIINNYMV